MKVILTAFGQKLKSEPQDWPEEVKRHHEIRMIMDMELKTLFETEDLSANFDTTRKMGKFVSTGKHFVLDNNETAEEYKLVEVS